MMVGHHNDQTDSPHFLGSTGSRHEEEVWHDYGLVLWHVGRHMEAAHNFQNAIITNPNFPKGHRGSPYR